MKEKVQEDDIITAGRILAASYPRPPLWLLQTIEAERSHRFVEDRKERNVTLRNLGLLFLTAIGTVSFLLWLTNVLTHRICR